MPSSSTQLKPTVVSLVVTGLLMLVASGVGYYFGRGQNLAPVMPGESLPAVSPAPTEPGGGVACTLEAKVCPDGSAVGRTGPNCEFAECPPVTDQHPGWKTYQNTDLGFSFQYPAKYRVTTDLSGWPEALVLLYDGGQSYNLAVFASNSAAEYEAVVDGPATDEVVVRKHAGRYVIFRNITHSPDIAEVIKTLKW